MCRLFETSYIQITPAFLSHSIPSRRRLTQMMEGTLEPDLGFVIALVGLEDQHIRPGKIEYETGQVEVLVKFTVMLFRPFRNEILDAQVTTVTEMGFFADAGPVQGIYVNKHQMPQDYGFDAQDNVWRTSDMEVEIRPGCGVRMRVVGVDITPGRMVRTVEAGVWRDKMCIR